MKKRSFLVFRVLIAFLMLAAAMFAKASVGYFASFLTWSSGLYLSKMILFIAVVCLVLGTIAIFRLIDTNIDTTRTRVWLIAGTLLIGSGLGWIFGSVLLMMHYP